MSMDTGMLLPKSVWDAIGLYGRSCDKSRFSMLRTAMERYAAAGWNGSIPQKGQKVKAAQAFLETLPVEKLRSAIQAVEKGCSLLGLDARGTSKNRSYVKKFLEHCEQEQWLIQPPTVEASSHGKPKKVYRFQNSDGQRRIYYVSSTGARNSPACGLGTQSGDYRVALLTKTDSNTYSAIACLAVKCASQVAGTVNLFVFERLSISCLAIKCASQVAGTVNLFVFEHQLINQALWQELETFAQSMGHLSGAEGVIQKVLQMLGYLHRIQGVNIEQLSLRTLVPFVKIHHAEDGLANDLTINLQGDSCFQSLKQIDNELSAQESIAQRRMRHKAKELIDWIDEYLRYSDQIRIEAGAKDGLANSTKQQTVYALIKLAEYIYKKEIANSKNIEIINQLNEKYAYLAPDRRQQKARVAARCLSWGKAIQVVELQREKADTRHSRAGFTKSGEQCFQRRELKAVVSEIQKLIILLLMVLIPTDRQQTYRRIQFRESLKIDEQIDGIFLLWGDRVGNELVPRSTLKNPEHAQWWLAVYEFKNLEHYEPFWYPLPNQRFSDGKTFYEYLKMWFFGLEDLVQAGGNNRAA